MSSEPMRITVGLIGDSHLFNESFRAALENEGWLWVNATNITTLLRESPSENILIGLFVDTVNSSVIEHIRTLTATDRAPIVVFSAYQNVADTCQILEAGAEDVISPPFSETEAIARLHAVARVRFGGHV